jgi:hypothetical protein
MAESKSWKHNVAENLYSISFSIVRKIRAQSQFSRRCEDKILLLYVCYTK